MEGGGADRNSRPLVDIYTSNSLLPGNDAGATGIPAFSLPGLLGALRVNSLAQAPTLIARFEYFAVMCQPIK